jgi:hypothetical protein
MEMMQICLCEIFAGITAALFAQRREIVGIFRLRDLDISCIAECFSMPAQSRRQYAIEHIESLRYRMRDIFRRSYSHQISGFIGR